MKPKETTSSGKRLDVDLATRKITRRDVDPEFRRQFVGGMGFSCKILYDEVGTDVDPFSPHNVVIFANGTLTGTNAPCAARVEITTKHPLTGHLGSGNTGGSWGTALRRAGFDLIVVRNEAEKPVYLWIDDDVCEIKDASHLWGKDTYATSHILEEELSPSTPTAVKAMAIGPAGENLVRYACGINEYYHCAARNGAGAVMGAKKLKAIAVRGTGAVRAAMPDEFRQAVRETRQRLSEQTKASRPHTRRDYTKEYLDAGSLPGKNFQTGVIPNWTETRNINIQWQYITRGLGTCHACPISCFLGAEVREGKYAGVRVSRGAHPGLIADFGAKCAIDNIPAIWKCKQLCHELGMDYMSASGVLSFAMELFQRGIITQKDTDGLELSWGNEDAAIRLLRKIAYRDGFGDLLAEGSVRAAERIGKGAEQCVMATKGMEMSTHDPRSGRRGWLFGDLTNPRGGDNLKSTHFDADNYNPEWWVDRFDMFEDVKKKAYAVPPEQIGSTWEGKPTMSKWFEDLYSVLNAMGICFFPAGLNLALGPTYLSRLFSTFTGWDTTPHDIMKAGGRVFTVMKAYTARQGLTRKNDRWPERFYTDPLSEGPSKGAVLSRAKMDELLDEYYELRGWSKETGLPTEEKLLELGLGDIAKDLVESGKLLRGEAT
ncbi:MAG: aldehyde ferredoxin oxidoreductase family protein [Candidatus Binatia bacterium]